VAKKKRDRLKRDRFQAEYSAMKRKMRTITVDDKDPDHKNSAYWDLGIRRKKYYSSMRKRRK